MPLYLPAPRIEGTSPADSGYLAWNFDSHGAVGTGSAPFTAAGTLYVQRLYIDRPVTITNIHVHVQTGGATLTSGQCKAAIYNAAGTLLQSTADQATSWASAAFKTMALVATVAALPGYYDVAAWYNGTTGPGFLRGSSWYTAGVQSGAALRSATANTGVTTTAPATLGTKTASAFNFFVALS